VPNPGKAQDHPTPGAVPHRCLDRHSSGRLTPVWPTRERKGRGERGTSLGRPDRRKLYARSPTGRRQGKEKRPGDGADPRGRETRHSPENTLGEIRGQHSAREDGSCQAEALCALQTTGSQGRYARRMCPGQQALQAWGERRTKDMACTAEERGSHPSLSQARAFSAVLSRSPLASVPVAPSQ